MMQVFGARAFDQGLWSLLGLWQGFVWFIQPLASQSPKPHSPESTKAL